MYIVLLNKSCFLCTFGKCIHLLRSLSSIIYIYIYILKFTVKYMAENPAYEDQQANQFGKYVKLRLLC